MKAAELMINDLVRTNKGEVIKAESISTKRQHRKVGYHSKDDAYHIKYVRQSQIEPIPLTEEILKANGFRKEEWDIGNIIRCGVNGKPSYVAFFEPTGCRTYFYIKGWGEKPLVWLVYNSERLAIKYVHELQRILRSCDLCDIADNFKLE